MSETTGTPIPNASAPAGRAARASPGRERPPSAPLLGHEEEPTIFDFSVPGRRSASFRTTGVPEWTAEELLPPGELRPEPPAVAEVSERDLVGHMTRLSHRQYSVDLGAYPLGSCTMKYNPKLCDEAAALPGLSQVHPATPAAYAQGWLELLWRLSDALCRITGMHAATLQPPAGASGELTGLLLMRAWHGQRGHIPDQGPHPGLGPRDQPGFGQLGWFHHGQCPVGPPGPGEHRRAAPAPRRRCGRDHAHQPEHHRPVRGGHRRAGRGRPRGGRPSLLRRGQPERHPRGYQTRGHGVRHRAHEPSQDVRGAPRRGWARRRAGGRDRGAGRSFTRSCTHEARRRELLLGHTRALDRQGAWVARQRSGSGSSLGVHHRQRRRRPRPGVASCSAQRQLAARSTPRYLCGPVRPACHARGRRLDQGGARV